MGTRDHRPERCLDGVTGGGVMPQKKKVPHPREYHPESTRFLEELCALIVISGGGKFSTTELTKMSVKELILRIYPNGIRLSASSIYWKRDDVED